MIVDRVIVRCGGRLMAARTTWSEQEGEQTNMRSDEHVRAGARRSLYSIMLAAPIALAAVHCASPDEPAPNIGVARQAVISAPANAPPSLKTVAVPRPSNLGDYVKDEQAAVRLGKALFWEMQVGSDGVTSCATCHFHAGADSRTKNQLAPGHLRSYSDGSPNPDKSSRARGRTTASLRRTSRSTSSPIRTTGARRCSGTPTTSPRRRASSIRR